MAERLVEVNQDDYVIVQITKEVLEVSEEEAVTTIMEIGLFNILNYPCGNTSQKHREIDKILSEGKYPELVRRLKEVFEL
jgi:hypothetical protein